MVETLNRTVYFCTYEYLKRYYFEQDNNEIMSLSGRMMSAAAAGIHCWAWLYPLDALRSQVYANIKATNNINGAVSGWQMAKIMYSNGGWRSFYRGFSVTTFRAGPVAAAILPVYDYTLDFLNKNRTTN